MAIIFGMQHYYQYLYGSEFIILSDHKPLIFSQFKVIPVMATARIQKWVILLGGYQYTNEPGP